jgi:hypothetical protein
VRIGKIIDWIGTNLGRIKTIGILLLILLVAVSMFRHGCDRNEMEDLVERITGLNVRNDILMEDVRQRDSLLLQNERRVQGLLDSLSASELRFADLQTDYGRLEDDYEDLSDSLLKIPADTSYQFLIKEAYPYPGHLKYPFNEPQVKGIHLTYLEKQSLGDMNLNLLAQLDEKEVQLELKDTVVMEKTAEIMLMKSNRQDLDSIIINKDEIIDVKDEQIQRVKRNRTFIEIAAGVIIVVLAALAAGGGK